MLDLLVVTYFYFNISDNMKSRHETFTFMKKRAKNYILRMHALNVSSTGTQRKL